MSQRVAFTALLLLAAAVLSSRAEARDRRIDATPFSHAPCSVLDNRPCTPFHCSVLDHGPCIVEIGYAYGQDLRLTIQSVPPEKDEARYRKPERDLDTIDDLFAALRSCWSPPTTAVAREGMQMSVRFSFRRTGEAIAAPRVTFATPGVSADIRAIYLKSIQTSLDACLPLKFTDRFAGALAGRPIAIRYVDNRALERVSPAP